MNMLQEGIKEDKITLNQMCNKVTTRYPEVYLHEQTTILLKETIA